MKQVKKISWKKDSGDGLETMDTYLWLYGEPTTHLVSRNSGIYYVYINDKEYTMCDSMKEAKDTILETLNLK